MKNPQGHFFLTVVSIILLISALTSATKPDIEALVRADEQLFSQTIRSWNKKNTPGLLYAQWQALASRYQKTLAQGKTDPKTGLIIYGPKETVILYTLGLGMAAREEALARWAAGENPPWATYPDVNRLGRPWVGLAQSWAKDGYRFQESSFRHNESFLLDSLNALKFPNPKVFKGAAVYLAPFIMATRDDDGPIEILGTANANEVLLFLPKPTEEEPDFSPTDYYRYLLIHELGHTYHARYVARDDEDNLQAWQRYLSLKHSTPNIEEWKGRPWEQFAEDFRVLFTSPNVGVREYLAGGADPRKDKDTENLLRAYISFAYLGKPTYLTMDGLPGEIVLGSSFTISGKTDADAVIITVTKLDPQTEHPLRELKTEPIEVTDNCYKAEFTDLTPGLYQVQVHPVIPTLLERTKRIVIIPENKIETNIPAIKEKNQGKVNN